ncbi:PP2C family protein-serine/threonine phosphatase [Diaphorobacter caeni]|uniref:PP2C family protein-serine/threonine phosphatase n=1 Tax=Diaphorobacter caeni TaxID=2784387 RepID=UPI001890B1A7|nr:PP2C family protein-serine/threonine phosphatase [Diaphorobacter caeni]MBF5005611.1 PP2C family protein-serine/threonine phosphatase [Diaphorobacter caeni]
MQLKRRILIILLLAMALLVSALTLMGWLGERRWQQRYNDALLQNQRIAWDKLQSEQLEDLEAIARRLLQDPAFAQVYDSAALQRIESLLARTMRESGPGMRIDVLSPRGTLLATTETALDPQPMAEHGWVRRAHTMDEEVQSLIQLTPQRYEWVKVIGFDHGAIAIGRDVSPHLKGLADYLGGQIAIANMRGVLAIGTDAQAIGSHRGGIPVRSQLAIVDSTGDGAVQVISQPLLNIDKRSVGALVWTQDVSLAHRSDQIFNAATLAAALCFAAALVLAIALYMRRAMEPLKRSVNVLRALANGRIDAALDDGDEESEDEAGAIARGVVAIRSELLNLETLRQERVRTRVQQERLIRDQLRTLADSLDPNSRDEILSALGTQSEISGSSAMSTTTGGHNQLAELAGILGRMSGLVSTQQNRLLKLLRELQASMQTQALLASLQQELEIARQMQLSILPRTAPLIREVEIAATMIPAKEVGGDFYDYFAIDDEHLAVVVADVSGKGIPAAFFMAISRTLLKSNALHHKTPGRTISALNDQLCAENDQMMFVTVFYGVLHLQSGRFTYVNAGHNPPVRVRSGQADYFPSGQNMALAVLEEQDYGEGEMQLDVDDTLVFYTDGVTEATNHDGALFGEPALLDALRGASTPRPTALIPQQLVQAVRDFEAGAAQADDITVVALTYLGNAP